MQKITQFIKQFFDIKFWKFVLVGVINTLVGAAIMFVFYNVFHFSYWISTASNYFFASILSYFLNRYFTFQYRDQSFWSILRFIINIVVCYLIAYGIAQPLVILIFSGAEETVQTNIAMLAGMVFFVALNYIGQRFFVFRENKKGPDEKNPKGTGEKQ